MRAPRCACSKISSNATSRLLNADDPEVTKRMPAKPHIYWFSRQKRVAAGAFLRDDQIIFRNEGEEVAARAARQIRPARRAQRRKCSGRLRRRVSCRADARRHRRRREKSFAASSIASNSSPKSPACSSTTIPKPPTWTPRSKPSKLSRAAGRDSRRQRQRQPLHAAARAAPRTRAPGAADRRSRGKNRRRSRDAVPFEHAGTLDRAVQHRLRSTRSLATRCCSRRLAPASISSKITNTAAASFKELVRDSRKSVRSRRDSCRAPAEKG